MYKIILTLSNPMAADSEVMEFQFDPATLNQAKWNAAFDAVAARLATLKARAANEEPPTW